MTTKESEIKFPVFKKAKYGTLVVKFLSEQHGVVIIGDENFSAGDEEMDWFSAHNHNVWEDYVMEIKNPEEALNATTSIIGTSLEESYTNEVGCLKAGDAACVNMTGFYKNLCGKHNVIVVSVDDEKNCVKSTEEKSRSFRPFLKRKGYSQLRGSGKNTQTLSLYRYVITDQGVKNER